VPCCTQTDGYDKASRRFSRFFFRKACNKNWLQLSSIRLWAVLRSYVTNSFHTVGSLLKSLYFRLSYLFKTLTVFFMELQGSTPYSDTHHSLGGMFSQFNSLHNFTPVPLNSILIFPSHLTLDIPSALFPCSSVGNTRHAFLDSRICATCLVHLFFI
jgi:hypothetical protein